jgi:hypothetical protein
MFLFKEKKIVVDCFTIDPFASEYAKISPAVKYYPEWWKDLPSVGPDNSQSVNMKGCLGLTNLYKNSFIIPMWGSLTINLSNKNMKAWRVDLDYKIEHAASPLSNHNRAQYPGFVEEDFIHIKIEAPWLLKTKSNIKFMLVDPIWNRNSLIDYSILPGVVDYHYQPSAAINMMFKLYDQPRQVHFKPGNVMSMIVPLTENDIDFRCHLVDSIELYRQFPQIKLASSSKQKRYSIFKKFINKHEERQESKCPFGFK